MTKSFGRVDALADANITVQPGRIVALVGENGAGKSTLVRIIAGELSADSGTVDVSTAVGLVRQQLSTVPDLTVLENIALGSEIRGRIDWRRLRGSIEDLIEQTGLVVPLDAEADSLPVGLQQRGELLSALHRGARCLLLDEPTTYLTPHEVDGLFETISGLTASGASAVFISHKLREVAQNCDEVTVLARGSTVATFDRGPFDLAAIGRAMTSPPRTSPSPTSETDFDLPPPTPILSETPSEEPLLEAAAGRLTVRRGHILGVAGVAGNGQDELVHTISGLGRHPAWRPVLIAGEDVTSLGTGRRRDLGLRIVPSNARAAAVSANMALLDNFLTARPSSAYVNRLGWLRRRRASAATQEALTRYQVVSTGPEQRAGQLSGGSLQRFVVSRELAPGAQILLAHEPTRGVDFAAAAAIRRRIREFARAGHGVLLLTSDLDELLELSDDIHVLFESRLGRAFPRHDLDLAALGELLGGIEHPAVGEATS